MSITTILKVISVLITVWFFALFDKAQAAEHDLTPDNKPVTTRGARNE